LNDPAHSRVAFANTLRGIAALCVVIQHYGHVFWNERIVTAGLINAPVLALPPLTPAYLRWVGQMQPFELGQFGVGLFFLISGFVIPFSFTKNSWRAFVVGRLTRIYPTFAAGFVCTLIVLWLCGSYFERSFPYDSTSVVAQFFPGVQDMALTTGIDGIIWTLNIEMKFYLVCVLTAGLFARGSASVFLVPLALTVVAWLLVPMTNAIGGEMGARASAIYLAIQFIDLMFIGVVFSYLIRGLISKRVAVAAIVVMCLAMAAVWVRALPINRNYAWSYAAAVLTFAAAYTIQRTAIFRPTRITEFFADISYPLYLIHGVIGYAAMRVLLDFGSPAGLALALTFCGVVGLATLLHIAVEAPTHQWGRRLALRWPRRTNLDAPHRAPALRT
jgi:peptidoglycan/LPS O-acetylase OafA/YrhL